MTGADSPNLTGDQVAVGDRIPDLVVEITPTLIVAGAMASRDFQDVHHDRDLAQKRGSRDIFMNILTTNGLVGRYVTDWAGPEALLQRVAIRLGAPNYPYDTMTLSGVIVAKDGEQVTVEIVGRNGLGDHVTGTVDLRLAHRGEA